MKQKDKDLLLKDLCARLPYNPMVEYKGETYNVLGIAHGRLVLCKPFMSHTLDEHPLVEEVKPYLFPLSSMTKEQYEEWCDLEADPLDEILTRKANGEKMSTLEHHLLIAKSLTDSVNYCYKNHFDIYGLIEKGLANDATGLNIY